MKIKSDNLTARPSLSIIVPIYNVEKYLPRCINSILKQTYKNFELILVNDGSHDNCATICDNYATKDIRIKVIHQKNSGVSSARNAGLKIAKGDYIGFVDPDDFIVDILYEELIIGITKSNSDMAICGYDYVDEDGVIYSNRVYNVMEDEIITQKELMSRCSDMPPTIRLGVCNKLFRKKLIAELFFDEKLHSAEDVLFLNEYIKNVNCAIIIHKPLYENTIRVGSATHGGLDIQSLSDSFSVHDKMYKDIVSLYPQLKDHTIAFLLDVCTLKYRESNRKFLNSNGNVNDQEKLCIKHMKKYIKQQTIKALFNREIYWKTKIFYIILQ